MLNKHSVPGTGLFLAVCSILVLAPMLFPGADIYYRVMSMAFLYGALACAWNFYALTGSISLGHAAFFGLGSYGSALLNYYVHLSPYVTILFGGLTGAIYGVIWHISFKRLRGAPLALATLASVEIPRVVIDNWDSFTFGSLGLVGISRLPRLNVGHLILNPGESPTAQYYLLLFFMAAIGLLHWSLFKCNWGWAVRAVREDETAASMLGVDTAGTRLRSLLLSSFVTGLCGGFYAHLLGLIEPALVFSLHISALPLVLSMFGGRYQFYGPLLGALILYPLDQLFLHSLLPVGHAIIYGVVIVFTLLFLPLGVGSWLQQRVKPA